MMLQDRSVQDLTVADGPGTGAYTGFPASRSTASRAPAANRYLPDEAGFAARLAELSPQQKRVLAVLAEGASNKEIARRFAISAETAKVHVATLLRRLDVPSRTRAAVFYAVFADRAMRLEASLADAASMTA